MSDEPVKCSCGMVPRLRSKYGFGVAIYAVVCGSCLIEPRIWAESESEAIERWARFRAQENASSKKASVPEPAPTPGRLNVPDSLAGWLFSAGLAAEFTKDNDGGHWAMALDLVNERDAFGRAKYKTPLMTGNGRNMVEDARQECGDLMMYIHGAKMEGRDLSEIRALVKVLQLMVDGT